ncbi:hypothetical protein HYFRA_00010724 [Hymenoscyphus fraxineus]|uniref:Uncharacterized protein n=1 Tax=Hymenoscyphus fraxineus TaxID=746836 RepID=A0A9N9L297_9HELO|nr:hypothetical protein HYFRA_00010724 [Hymenoscyphus fraxineus]
MGKGKDKRPNRHEDESFSNEEPIEPSANPRKGDRRRGSSTSNSAPAQPQAGPSTQADSQASYQPDQFTLAVRQGLPKLSETIQVLKALEMLYVKHKTDVENISKIHQLCESLQQQCEAKDFEIRDLESHTRVLIRRADKKKEQHEQERCRLANESEALEKEKASFKGEVEKEKKRLEMRKFELEKEHDNKLKEAEREQRQHFEKQKKHIENQTKEQVARMEKQLRAFESTNKDLQEGVKETGQKLAEIMTELQQLKTRCDDETRLKEHFREDVKKYQVRVVELQNEFQLGNKTPDFFKTEFNKVFTQIDTLGFEYFLKFNDNVVLPVKKRENTLTIPQEEDDIRRIVAISSSSFKFMPVSDTLESQKLRISHVQQVISSALLKSIWKPFASENTLQSSEFCLLESLAARLAVPVNGVRSKRVSRLWSALTTRSLCSTGAVSSSSAVALLSHGPTLSWAEQVSRDIHEDILLFADPSKVNSLYDEVFKIVASAIALWKDVQNDQLEITIDPVLDLKQREDWRSQRLDPQDIDLQLESKIATRPRVFRLFPRITAFHSENPEMDSSSEPEEICIHPGVGIPESAPWVAAGRAEEEDRVRILAEGMEELKKSANERAKKRSCRSRRGSTASIVGASSPTSLWKKEGKIMIAEE